MGLIVDVHAHLDHPYLRHRLASIVKNAKEAGLHCIITNGLEMVSNRAALDISEKYDIIKPALGIYPPDALRNELKQAFEEGYIQKKDSVYPEFNFDEEMDFIRKKVHKIIAIGEIGLDYNNNPDIQLQKNIFSSLIETAIKKSKPIIVHSRKAESDVMEILEGYNYKKTVMHCFSGKKALIKKGVDLGFSFSVPANVVKSTHFQNLVDIVPLSHLLTETDSPFLSPFKDKQNEPAFVTESIKKISEIKKLEFEEASRIVFMNFKNMF